MLVVAGAGGLNPVLPDGKTWIEPAFECLIEYSCGGANIWERRHLSGPQAVSVSSGPFF
jgi:hypothetical protein